MSLGLMLDRSPSMPSMSTRGELLLPSPMEPTPRMLMFIAVPGAPPASLVMFRPATAPCSPCTASVSGRESRISLSMVFTAPVALSFFCVP